ncbi:MAG: hypothetical protein DRI79_02360, partial [Chloroflexi bacterium]
MCTRDIIGFDAAVIQVTSSDTSMRVWITKATKQGEKRENVSLQQAVGLSFAFFALAPFAFALFASAFFAPAPFAFALLASAFFAFALLASAFFAFALFA